MGARRSAYTRGPTGPKRRISGHGPPASPMIAIVHPTVRARQRGRRCFVREAFGRRGNARGRAPRPANAALVPPRDVESVGWRKRIIRNICFLDRPCRLSHSRHRRAPAGLIGFHSYRGEGPSREKPEKSFSSAPVASLQARQGTGGRSCSRSAICAGSRELGRKANRRGSWEVDEGNQPGAAGFIRQRGGFREVGRRQGLSITPPARLAGRGFFRRGPGCDNGDRCPEFSNSDRTGGHDPTPDERGPGTMISTPPS